MEYRRSEKITDLLKQDKTIPQIMRICKVKIWRMKKMNEEMKTGMLLSYQSVKEQVDTIKAELKRKGIEKNKGLSVLEAFIDDNIKWLNREQ